MTTICIVRHGETDWNKMGKLQGQTDTPLNAAGIQQAKECGQFLKNEQWDLIISSSLQRAKRTAEIINEQIGSPLIVMDEFKERYFGDAEGMTKEERKQLFPDGCYPNQEEREAVYERVQEGLQKIHALVPNGKVILVSHGAVINAILYLLSDGELGSGIILLHNGSMTNIQYDGEKWQILNYNQVAHLSSV